MAITYTGIAKSVLTGSQATVTFSGIPQTYTDLVVLMSVRSDSGSTFNTFAMQINGSSSAIYSFSNMEGYNGTSVFTGNGNAQTQGNAGWINGTGSASNIFTSTEIYFPSYTNTSNPKPFAITSCAETTSTTAFDVESLAGRFNSANAITSISFFLSGQNIVSGSSFYLYGIKDS